MTGVEAVSNGVMAFREPSCNTARTTLTIIVGVLIAMLAGLAFLVRAYGIGATPPGEPGYDSVLSQLIAAIAGKSVFYWISIGAILVVLSLSANTAFADFPRLSRAIAQNGFLPHPLALRGRRLVFEKGIYALALLAGGLLILFGGITDRLIPLYAVGAFMAFTLSQAGMVMHWKRVRGRGYRSSMMVNGLGATATAITVAVVLMHEVHRRRLDHAAPHSGADSDDALGQAALQPRRPGDRHPGAGECGGAASPIGRAADREMAHRRRQRDPLCLDHLTGRPGAAYRMRGGDRRDCASGGPNWWRRRRGKPDYHHRNWCC